MEKPQLRWIKKKVDYLKFQRKIFCPNVGDFNVLRICSN